MKLFERATSRFHQILNGLTIVLVEHVPIFIFMIFYFMYGFYIEYRLGNYNIIDFNFNTERIISKILIVNFIIFFVGHYALRVARNNINGIYYKWYDIISTYFCFNRLGGFIIICALVPIELNLNDNLKMCIPDILPFYYDIIFMKLDYIIHFNNHPWVFYLPILTHTITARAIDSLYISWYFGINIFIFWLSWSNRRKLRMQFFLTSILILFIIGNCFATFLSSAGPCYFDKVTKVTENNPYRPLMEKLHTIDKNTPLVALELQDRLWDNYVRKGRLFGHYIAAMPSVHVAFAALLALTISPVNIYLGIILWVYWAVIQIGSVILGWHYAIDGYFSTILTIGLWKISGFFNNWYWKKLSKNVQAQILNPNVSIL